jgi:hypothetical protein
MRFQILKLGQEFSLGILTSKEINSIKYCIRLEKLRLTCFTYQSSELRSWQQALLSREHNRTAASLNEWINILLEVYPSPVIVL